MHWSVAYVGIPYDWQGYGHNGASCWGLVWLVMGEVFGIDIPRHNQFVQRIEDGDKVDYKVWSQDRQMIDPSDYEDGDIMHLNTIVGNKKWPLHAGVYCDGGYVLHTTEKTGAIIERMDSPNFRWRLIGGYRV